MKKTFTFFLLVLLLFPLSCKQERLEPVELEIGKKAPPFSLKDLNGKTVRLSDLEGKVVMIDFWATWCHACKLAAPALERLHKKYGDRDFVLLGISLDEGPAAEKNVTDFVRKYSQTYPMLMGSKDIKDRYEINKIPTTFLLDRKHLLVKRYVGFIPRYEEEMAKDIEELLSPGD